MERNEIPVQRAPRIQAELTGTIHTGLETIPIKITNISAGGLSAILGGSLSERQNKVTFTIQGKGGQCLELKGWPVWSNDQRQYGFQIEGSIVCTVCKAQGSIFNSPDISKVASNVREFRDESFTVWRCKDCGSLHSQEAIDFARYYRRYPMKLQKVDFFTRLMFNSRLKLLRKAGLRSNHSILDYGTGNGAFMNYLKSKGFAGVVGYDPHSNVFCDEKVLDQRYDFVMAQDVIEHVENPVATIELLSQYLNPCGTLCLGTPDAERIRLDRDEDRAGQLHQPFHRHILSYSQMENILMEKGFEIVFAHRRWYVDTLFPFLNSTFLVHYLVVNGGFLDVGFEPIKITTILTSPRLLLYGFVGYFFSHKNDMLIFATKHS